MNAQSWYFLELRKEKRDELLNGKRMRIDENEIDDNDITVQQVGILTFIFTN